jgi:hypothetical protein
VSEPVALSESFGRFLGDRYDAGARHALVDALEAAGHRLEARLLSRWDGGLMATEIDLEDFVWSGRRAWVGPVLPVEPEAGEIWLDVCELVPMLLLPREAPADPSEYAPGVLERLTPFVAWLSLRPVARWQLAGFLSQARLAPREVQVPPRARALDRERLLDGDEAAPVTAILPGETALYASYFWKGLGGRGDWEAARAALTREELAALWGPLRREWDSAAVTEGIFSVVTPDTVDVDPDDAYDEDPDLADPDRIVFGELEAPADTGFRTHVNTQIGLRAGSGNPLAILDVQLLDAVDRE